jgi:hypothetical protein
MLSGRWGEGVGKYELSRGVVGAACEGGIAF